MRLEDKSMKELLTLHNGIADSPAGPKTFSTRAKLVARIRALAAAKNVNLESIEPSDAPAVPVKDPAPAVAPASTEQAKAPTKRGLGIGELARMLIMDPAGYPHSLIATMVNAQIPGATATDKSVRWYAAKMRKEGVEVPPRHKAFAAVMDEKESKEWLSTVRVVGEATE